MRPRPSAHAGAARLLLLSLVILAFGLRLCQLDYQSLWRDELDAIRFARRDLSGLMPLFVKPGHNGPLYYTILHFWIRLTGDSEFSARFFSLVCGVLAIPLIFKLGQWWMGRSGSLLVALLCATSPYLIWYSQEAKMYALLFLLSVLSTHVYLLALRRNRIYLWLFYLASVVVAMYVHLLAVLIIPFHLVLFLVTWPRYRKAVRPWLVTFVILALPYLPLARWEVRLLISPFTTGHQFYSLTEILTILLFAFSLNSAPYRGLLPITLFIFLVLAGIFLYRREKGDATSLGEFVSSRQESISSSLYLFVPIVCLFLVSLGMPIFTDRYLISVVPAYLLLLAFGLLAVKQRSAPLVAICLALLLLCNVYMVWWQGHTKIKSDFRSAAAYVRHDGRGDLMVFLIPHGRLVFQYYYEDEFSWAEAPYTDGGMEANQVAQDLAGDTAGHEEVWLVVSEDELWDSRGLVKEWFDEHAALLSHGGFARVDLYLYSLGT